LKPFKVVPLTSLIVYTQTREKSSRILKNFHRQNAQILGVKFVQNFLKFYLTKCAGYGIMEKPALPGAKGATTLKC
jgi:hypothetical protein